MNEYESATQLRDHGAIGCPAASTGVADASSTICIHFVIILKLKQAERLFSGEKVGLIFEFEFIDWVAKRD